MNNHREVDAHIVPTENLGYSGPHSGEGAGHGHSGSLLSPPLSPTKTSGSQDAPCVWAGGRVV